MFKTGSFLPVGNSGQILNRVSNKIEDNSIYFWLSAFRLTGIVVMCLNCKKYWPLVLNMYIHLHDIFVLLRLQQILVAQSFSCVAHRLVFYLSPKSSILSVFFLLLEKMFLAVRVCAHSQVLRIWCRRFRCSLAKKNKMGQWKFPNEEWIWTTLQSFCSSLFRCLC